MTRSFAVVAMLLLIPIAFVHPAAASMPNGDGEILSPTEGTTIAQHGNVTLSYTWPTNVTNGNVSIQLKLDDVYLGNLTRRYAANGTDLINATFHVPAWVPDGPKNLSASFWFAPGPFGEIYYDHDVVGVIYGHPENRPPTLHAVNATYEVGSGFLVRVDASDPDAYDPLAVTVVSALGDDAILVGPGLWLHRVEPESLGTVELVVTVWDSVGHGAARRILGTVVGREVVVYDQTFDITLGAHADVEEFTVPSRLLQGNAAIECSSGCPGGVALVWEERPTQRCINVLGAHTTTCPFETPHAPSPIRIVHGQAIGTFRVRMTAIAV